MQLFNEIAGGVVGGVVGGLAGGACALLGVWIAPIIQRRIQRSGLIRYRLSDFTWDKEYSGMYTFYIKVFNETDQGTGVRDVAVKFVDKTKQRPDIVDYPKDTVEDYFVDYLNFPSQQWTVRKLRAGNPQKTEAAKECHEAYLIAHSPGNRKHQMRIFNAGEDPVDKEIPNEEH
jgi:hypothetical protein